MPHLYSKSRSRGTGDLHLHLCCGHPLWCAVPIRHLYSDHIAANAEVEGCNGEERGGGELRKIKGAGAAGAVCAQTAPREEELCAAVICVGSRGK